MENDINQSSPVIPNEKTDISKTTITVLVLVTLMISVLGTWTVLNELSNVKTTQQAPSSSSGEVKLNIVSTGQNVPDQTGATGRVSLTIE